MKKLFLMMLVSVFAYQLSAQELQTSNAKMDIGLDFQAYPTGIIPGLKIEKLLGDKGAFGLRLGYQFIDHQDFGVQDNEIGTGYGFSLGYKHYFQAGHEGLSLGIKNDVWFNSIDWENVGPFGITFNGTSDIIVVQPTVELGYLFKFGDALVLTPSVAFGREFNVKTEGEEVGQGFIILGGLTLSLRI